MLAKKCDVCGVLYEAYGYRCDKESEANAIMFVNNRSNGNSYGVNGVRDLCPECRDALIALFRERGMKF